MVKGVQTFLNSSEKRNNRKHVRLLKAWSSVTFYTACQYDHIIEKLITALLRKIACKPKKKKIASERDWAKYYQWHFRMATFWTYRYSRCWCTLSRCFIWGQNEQCSHTINDEKYWTLLPYHHCSILYGIMYLGRITQTKSGELKMIQKSGAEHF